MNTGFEPKAFARTEKRKELSFLLRPFARTLIKMLENLIKGK
jgi:hypothetical protein